MDFEGVFPILPTPFHDDETLDLESLSRVVSFMQRAGANGVTVLGVLGEANRLSDSERERVVETAVKAAPGLPVIVGASASGTRAATELARMAQQLGAAAVMITPHAEPVPNDDRVLEYYQTIAQGMALPIILQDHPASSGVHMTPALIARIVEKVPAVACLKEEAVPTAPKIRQLRRVLPRSLRILTGLGALYGLFDLEAGSDGFNTGFAFPEALLALYRQARAGEWREAQEIYRQFLPLIVFEQQPGVAVRKEIFRLRGLLTSSRVRHPGSSISPETADQLRALIKRVLPGVELTRPLALGRSAVLVH